LQKDFGPQPAAPPAVTGNGAGEPGWQSLLTQESATVTRTILPGFETLRAWRTARSRAEAVPPYVVLTNLQLARVASEAPRTLAALREIPGIGASRVERFGAELLEVIRSGVVPAGASAPAAAAEAARSTQEEQPAETPA
jgi:superfamily II DNA helicase RecQ